MEQEKDYDKFRTAGFRKIIDGLTAYDILRMPDCPITLPTARSMTQAALDVVHAEPSLIEWYKNNKLKSSPEGEGF